MLNTELGSLASFPKGNLAAALPSLDAEQFPHSMCLSFFLHPSFCGLKKNADVALSYTGAFSRMLYYLHCFFFLLILERLLVRPFFSPKCFCISPLETNAMVCSPPASYTMTPKCYASLGDAA